MEVPRIQACGRLSPSAIDLTDTYFIIYTADDALGDFVLKSEDVVELAIVALRPDMAIGGAVDQLSGNTDLVGCLADAAFDNIPHAKLFRGFFDVNVRPLVDER